MGEIVFQNGDYYRGHWTNDNMTDGFGKFTCETRKVNFPKHLSYHTSPAMTQESQPKVNVYIFLDPDGTVYLGEITGGSTVRFKPAFYNQHIPTIKQ